jgi:hypothetical protein
MSSALDDLSPTPRSDGNIFSGLAPRGVAEDRTKKILPHTLFFWGEGEDGTFSSDAEQKKLAN